MWIFILNFLMGFFSSEFLSRSFFHQTTRNLFGDFLLRRLLTDFRGCDLSGRCRYPLRVENVPQISQIYTDFSWDVFFVTQISQMTQIFYRGFFSSDDTEFRGCDLSGRCRYPLGSDKEIHQRFHKKSVYICEICGTKIIPRRKDTP